MLERHFTKVLLVTGLVTFSPLLMFLIPTFYLSANQLAVGDATGMLFARHWGLMAACFGSLLIYAALRPVYRTPIVFAAAVEKAGLVFLILMSWNDPAIAGLQVAAVFDGACVLLYGAYLLRNRTT